MVGLMGMEWLVRVDRLRDNKFDGNGVDRQDGSSERDGMSDWNGGVGQLDLENIAD